MGLEWRDAWRNTVRTTGAFFGVAPALGVKASDAKEGILLEVRGVEVRFGGIVALDGVTFDVKEGDIHGLIGPNGAGKTTLFNCLSRLYTPSSGEILFGGRSIMKLSPSHIALVGMGRTFQNVALFDTMSSWENVMVGVHARSRGGLLANGLRLPLARREEERIREEAWREIEYLGLEKEAHTVVSGLPFGLRKRVELARALAMKPKLLMLDEPAGGLNQDDVQELGGLLRKIREERSLTILLVEHHMGLVMKASDRVTVIDFGKKIGEGTPKEVQRDPEVVRAYLGHAGEGGGGDGDAGDVEDGGEGKAGGEE